MAHNVSPGWAVTVERTGAAPATAAEAVTPLAPDSTYCTASPAETVMNARIPPTTRRRRRYVAAVGRRTGSAICAVWRRTVRSDVGIAYVLMLYLLETVELSIQHTVRKGCDSEFVCQLSVLMTVITNTCSMTVYTNVCSCQPPKQTFVRRTGV